MGFILFIRKQIQIECLDISFIKEAQTKFGSADPFSIQSLKYESKLSAPRRHQSALLFLCFLKDLLCISLG